LALAFCFRLHNNHDHMGNAFETSSREHATIPQATRPFFRDSKNPQQDFFTPAPNNIVQREGDKKDAPADLAEPKEKSALRDELSKLFEEFEGVTVGDKKFDSIISQDDWEDAKSDEDEKKAKYAELKKAYDKKKKLYDDQLKAYRAGKGPVPTAPVPPVPVAVYTTCIDTQRVLLRKAFAAAGLKMQKTGGYGQNLKPLKDSKKSIKWAFATLGQQQAQELGAWTTAYIGIKERPKRGDIIVLASRGKSVDDAENKVKYLQDFVAQKDIKKATSSNEKAKEALAAATQANADAEAALEALKAANASGTSADMIKAKSMVKMAADSLKKARQKAEEAATALTKAENLVPDAQKKVDEARGKVDHSTFFQFSHVGFVESITKKDDDSETWKTFDGGQTLHVGKEDKQGAKSNQRTYRLSTNEIEGEASQGGMKRWLQGWVDIDKLADRSQTAK
jgi:hypothetical protein